MEHSRGPETGSAQSPCWFAHSVFTCGNFVPLWTWTPTSGPFGFACLCVSNMVMASSSRGWSLLVFSVVSVLSDPHPSSRRSEDAITRLTPQRVSLV